MLAMQRQSSEVGYEENLNMDSKKNSSESWSKSNSRDVSTLNLSSLIEKGDIKGLNDNLDNLPDLDLDRLDHRGQTLLHVAASSGRCDAIEFLISKGANLTTLNKKGDQVIHCAARFGHVDVLKLLKEKDLDLNLRNRNGETAIHLCTRSNHLQALEFLCSAGADVNIKDDQGDIALHTATWCGQTPEVCRILCEHKSNLNTKNKEDEAPIHFAAGRGNVECLKILIEFGADINIVDKRGSTPLHLACRRSHADVAMILLRAGCQLDVLDQLGETPIHSACHTNMVSVVQTMCSFGCRIDVVNKSGSTPLHISTRTGHIEAVRCLLLSGAPPYQTNENGITAEVLAISQGQNEIADLIGALKDKHGTFIRQLTPNEVTIDCIKMKVFGNSGVGKSDLIESLKCGFIGSLLRKAGIGGHHHTDSHMYCLNSLNSNVGSPKECTDVSQRRQSNTSKLSNTSKQSSKIKKASLRRRSSLKNKLEPVAGAVHDSCTQGIAIQQASIPGVGSLSIWDFSGFESYFVAYDHFIGDPNCVHLVVFNSVDPHDKQLDEISFWLEFIRIRLPTMEPLGKTGRSLYPCQVILVATHSNEVTETIEQHRTKLNSLHFEIVSVFSKDFLIYPKIIDVDSNQPMSADMKMLRSAICELKTAVLQHIHQTSQLFPATVAALPQWQKNIASFPVVTWVSFKDYIRSNVNILACEEHLRELMYLLQVTGEVVFLEAPEADNSLVVINPKWLGQDLIGRSLDISVRLSGLNPDGIFTRNEVLQRVFKGFCGEVDGYIEVLEALDLCSKLEDEQDCDDIIYEIASLVGVAKPQLREIWDADDVRFLNDVEGGDGVFGGVRLFPFCSLTTTQRQLHVLFPRIQTRARRYLSTLTSDQENEEGKEEDEKDEGTEDLNELFFWRGGFKCTRGNLEVIVTEEQKENKDWIEIKARGQKASASELFHFFMKTVNVCTSTIHSCCPTLELQYCYLSPLHLSQYQSDDNNYIYLHRNVLLAQKQGNDFVKKNESPLEHGVSRKNSSVELPSSCSSETKEMSIDSDCEKLIDILAFGSQEIYEKIIPGIDLPFYRLSVPLRRQMCSLLDPPNPLGQDWCLLSLSLGQSKELPIIDSAHGDAVSRTDQVLMSWSKFNVNPTVRVLVEKLQDIGRGDVIEALLNFCPLFDIKSDAQLLQNNHNNKSSAEMSQCSAASDVFPTLE